MHLHPTPDFPAVVAIAVVAIAVVAEACLLL